MPLPLINKSQLQKMLLAAKDRGVDPLSVVDELWKRGYDIEGAPNPAKTYAPPLSPPDPRKVVQEVPNPLMHMAGEFVRSAVSPRASAHLAKDIVSLPNDDKQALLNGVGEVVGGTAGALIGGPVGSAGGAVMGRIAGKVAGHYMVGPEETNPESGPDSSADMLRTMGGNYAGEVAGRMVPMAIKSGARALLGPDAAGREVVNLAAKQGVPLTVPMVSRAGQETQKALGRFPTSRGIVEKAKMASQVPWEESLGRTADKLHPAPVSNVEAGEAARGGLMSNRSTARGYFNPQYDKAAEMTGNPPVKLTNTAKAGKELSEEMVSPVTENFFPRGALKTVRAAADATDGAPDILDQLAASQAGGAKFKNLAPDQQKAIVDLANRMGFSVQDSGDGAASITFDQAKNLRTGLREANEGLRINAPAASRHSIPKVRASLEQDIDAALADKPDALAHWREVNGKYRQVEEALSPPDAIGKPGNNVAGVIENPRTPPEDLPRNIMSSPTRIRETEQALSPQTVDSITGEQTGRSNPMDKMRRNAADRVITGATAEDPSLGDRMLVNPRRLEKGLSNNAETVETAIGPDAYREFQEHVKTGKAFNPRNVSSGTAENTETIKEFKGAGKVATGLGAAALGAGATYYEGHRTSGERLGDALKIGAGILAPRYIAKGLNSHGLADVVLGAAPQVGGAIAGGIGRGLMVPFMRRKKPEEDIDPYTSLPLNLDASGPDPSLVSPLGAR